jgi:DeoR family transcriptional regulator, suf operon transcriptional repressor
MPEAIVSPAAMRVIKLLVGNPPLTVADLIDATGVTRTAVTEQLNELVAAGFVDRAVERLPGRGRPRHLYSANAAALLLLFASNQQVVVPAIWQAIDELGGDQLRGQIARRVTQLLADHYRPRITGHTPEERLRQVTQMLCEEGHLVDVKHDGDGQLVLRKRTCPFINMFEENRTVCGVDLDLLSELVGAPVEQTTSRHDGAPCCTFAVATATVGKA